MAIRLLGLLATLILGCVSAFAAADGRPPNVILVMSDDQGWGDVGFNGNDVIRTPHLDQMAADGVKFNRFYAAAPLCSPTRGSCLTGRYPFRFGVLAAHTGGMRVGEITIAELLQRQNYRTGFFGKWHLGWVKESDAGSRGFFSPPSQHGFDYTFTTTSAVPTWNPTVTPDDWDRWGNEPGSPWKGGTPYVENGREVSENMAGDDSRVIMDRVVPFLKDDPSTPFFAAVWFHAPHEPVVAGPEYRAIYDDLPEPQQHLYGAITAMDEQIGRLRATIDELGETRNTLIFFCSDNGPADALAKKGIASAGPFKGYKHRMYEGGLLVPACCVWPGEIPAGTTTDVRCSTVDFLPTIQAMTGAEFRNSERRPIDGINLMPVMRGEQKERGSDLFFGYRRLHSGIDGQAVISGDWKLLREAKKDGRVRLYNIAEDPFEKHDLAASHPDHLAEMSQRMSELDASCQRSRDGADYRY